VRNRWRIPLRKLDQKLEANIANVVASAMVLHNLMIDLNDPLHVHGSDPFFGLRLGLESQFVATETFENHRMGKKKGM
jgi:hypothetical protein